MSDFTPHITRAGVGLCSVGCEQAVGEGPQVVLCKKTKLYYHYYNAPNISNYDDYSICPMWAEYIVAENRRVSNAFADYMKKAEAKEASDARWRD